MNTVRNEGGTTLVETMIAVVIALIAIASLGSVIIQATMSNKNQGQETTRATIYAQDKMEALLALSFVNCTKSSTSQPASCNTTGNADVGWTQGLLAGGALTPVETACPSGGASVGYVDYLDNAGVQMTGTSCAALTSATGATLPSYVRQWQIADLASTGPALKQITVALYSLNQLNADPAKPVVVLTSVVSN